MLPTTEPLAFSAASHLTATKVDIGASYSGVSVCSLTPAAENSEALASDAHGDLQWLLCDSVSWCKEEGVAPTNKRFRSCIKLHSILSIEDNAMGQGYYRFIQDCSPPPACAPMFRPIVTCGNENGAAWPLAALACVSCPE